MDTTELTYLAHHGIRRQRWGIRRFQNYDGSLTKAGRERQRLGKRDVSKMSRFDVDRYKNKDESLTHLGRDKFAEQKRHRKSRRSNSKGRLTPQTVLAYPVSSSAASRGHSAVSSVYGSLSSLTI